jgi:acyl phosphate:glycerol-3-phosphate acyltransferase
MITLVLTLAAYLIGSVSFAVIVSHAFKLPDPRSYGSGNPGATNVLRSGRKAAAVLTLLGDSGKGWVAVVLAGQFAAPPDVEIAVAAAGLAAVVGHMYPVFHRFQGGKGVATALGVLFGFNIYVALGAASTWIIIALFFRISSLAAIVAAVFVPIAIVVMYNPAHPYFAASFVIAVMLVYRHKANIQKLLAGSENRFGR